MDQGQLGHHHHPLIADFNKKIARDYQCLDENAGIALRATYIIDPDGDIVHAECNITRLGRSVDEVVRLLQAGRPAIYVRSVGRPAARLWAKGSRRPSRPARKDEARVDHAQSPSQRRKDVRLHARRTATAGRARGQSSTLTRTLFP